MQVHVREILEANQPAPGAVQFFPEQHRSELLISFDGPDTEHVLNVRQGEDIVLPNGRRGRVLMRELSYVSPVAALLVGSREAALSSKPVPTVTLYCMMFSALQRPTGPIPASSRA